jgi:uncharacterized membrane protein (TIGR01666 family)
MQLARQRLRYFFFSQYLADGIRITLEIILPVIVFAQIGQMNTGLTIATGAFCVSITDAPGPLEHKRNGMLYCLAFMFGMSLLTGLLNSNLFFLGLLIAGATFFFTMFSVFGNRAGLVGTASLIMMILRMPVIATPVQIVTDSLLVLAGGAWYTLIAMLVFRLKPYRPVQRALGDCIHEIAQYLKIKSAMYDTHTDFDIAYRNLLTQQMTVHEKQEALREMLFKDKDLMKEPTSTSRLLVLTFAATIDLYEQVMATWYDYRSLRHRYANTGLLVEVSSIIKEMAEELDRIGLAIQSNTTYEKQYLLLPALDKLKDQIDALNDGKSKLVLKKILVNLRNMGYQADELSLYFSASISETGKLRTVHDYARFVSHQEIDRRIFINNLTLESGVFRHALRVMITCIIGFAITKIAAYGHHSYWVLLTSIVILKPGFSLTRQRNRERLIGTIAGGLIALFLIHFIHDRDLLFAFIIFFMIGTYTFQRLNYIIMVIFITPYVLILFNLLGMGFINVAQERLIDTAVACTLAFGANHLLFPHWESTQLNNNILKMLKANLGYLKKLLQIFCGKEFTLLEYKLARKDLYSSSANLSAAFQRMLSEPKSKQKNGKQLYEFMVLNNVLASNIASISADRKSGHTRSYPKQIILPVIRSINNLQESIRILEPDIMPVEENKPVFSSIESSTDPHLEEQVNFILGVTADIRKVTPGLTKAKEKEQAPLL